MWRDFFYFSKKEKQGIIILTILISVIVFVNLFMGYGKSDEPVKNDSEAFEKEYAEFIASLRKTEKEEDRVPSSRYNKKTAPVTFKPSYNRVKRDTFKKDSVGLFINPIATNPSKAFKYPEGTVLDLNSADTTELKKIPGIGSGIAGRIINYRNRLGGFYRIEQLAEIGLNTDVLANWFYVDSTKTVRIDLNKASVDRLRRHPYFNFYQARVIVEHRKKNGSLKSLKQLSLYEEFTEEDFKRIERYVRF